MKNAFSRSNTILIACFLAQVVLLSACVPAGEAAAQPTRILTGTWEGTYTWNCGAADLQGSSELVAELSSVRGSPFIGGTLTYLGETVSITNGYRCNAEGSVLDSSGSLQCGQPDPLGAYLVMQHEASDKLVYNRFTGLIQGETITGTILNGNSPVPMLDSEGCSHPEHHSGTFELRKAD